MPTTQSPSCVVLLATGGTISSREASGGKGAAVAHDVGAELLTDLHAEAMPRVRVVDVLRRGSYALSFDDMVDICTALEQALADPEVLGAVVAHGTDTMEETAYMAELVIDSPKPVLFTGAQRLADSAEPDGPENLAAAIRLAGSGKLTNSGVMISFAGRLFPARGVRKTDTVRLQAFANPDFGSSDATDVKAMTGNARPLCARLPIPAPGATPRVEVIALHPGADAVILRAALDAGAQGVVLQGSGNGNANPDICQAVAHATASGVVVVTSTRVNAGPVLPIYGNGGGADLLEAGAIPSGCLRPSQSWVLLSLLLAAGHQEPEIRKWFGREGARS